MTETEPASVAVVVEEHPELDNPIGRAHGRVEAAETIAGEAVDIVERLGEKLARAESAVEMCKEQLDAAETDVGAADSEVEDARAALAALENEVA